MRPANAVAALETLGLEGRGELAQHPTRDPREAAAPESPLLLGREARRREHEVVEVVVPREGSPDARQGAHGSDVEETEEREELLHAAEVGADLVVERRADDRRRAEPGPELGRGEGEEEHASHAVTDPVDALAAGLAEDALDRRRDVEREVLVDAPREAPLAAETRLLARARPAEVHRVDRVPARREPRSEPRAHAELVGQRRGSEAVAEEHRLLMDERARLPVVDGDPPPVAGLRVEERVRPHECGCSSP